MIGSAIATINQLQTVMRPSRAVSIEIIGRPQQGFAAIVERFLPEFLLTGAARGEDEFPAVARQVEFPCVFVSRGDWLAGALDASPCCIEWQRPDACPFCANGISQLLAVRRNRNFRIRPRIGRQTFRSSDPAQCLWVDFDFPEISDSCITSFKF